MVDRNDKLCQRNLVEKNQECASYKANILSNRIRRLDYIGIKITMGSIVKIIIIKFNQTCCGSD